MEERHMVLWPGQAYIVHVARGRATVQVLEWLAQHVQGVSGGMGRFESEPAWRMAVSKRRTAAHPESTFLQELQETLTDVHVSLWEPSTVEHTGCFDAAARPFLPATRKTLSTRHVAH